MKSSLKRQKPIKNLTRHIRWNWEISPNNVSFVRYHFVIVDDKERKEKINKILHYAQSKSIVKFPFEEIRAVKGKVKGSKLKYLFISYDTKYNSVYMNPENVFDSVKKDEHLYERQRTNIEDYVANLYG